MTFWGSSWGGWDGRGRRDSRESDREAEAEARTSWGERESDETADQSGTDGWSWGARDRDTGPRDAEDGQTGTKDEEDPPEDPFAHYREQRWERYCDHDDDREDGDGGRDPHADPDDDVNDGGDGGQSDGPRAVTLTALDDSVTTDEDTPLELAAPGVLGNDTGNAADLRVTAVNGSMGDVGGELALDGGGLASLSEDGSLTFDPDGQFETLAVGEQVELTLTYTVTGTGAAGDGDAMDDGDMDGGDMDGADGDAGHDRHGSDLRERWRDLKERWNERRNEAHRNDSDDADAGGWRARLDDWRERRAAAEDDAKSEWHDRDEGREREDSEGRTSWGWAGREEAGDGGWHDGSSDGRGKDDRGWLARLLDRGEEDVDDEMEDRGQARPDDDYDDRPQLHKKWSWWGRDSGDEDDNEDEDGDDGRRDDDGGTGGMPGDTEISDTATITIVVEGVNDAPVAVDDGGGTLEGFAIDIDVLGNDSDIDGDVLSVDSVTQPAKGSVTINGDGTLAFDPGSDFDALNTGESETVTFSYTVADGNGGTDEGEVEVTVDGFDPGSQTNTDVRNNVALSLTTAERTIDGTTDVSGSIQFPNLDFNLAFVVDVSNSTNAPFGGTAVGDQNGDGSADTVLDAEIASLKALAKAIGEDAGLQDPASQVDIGVVSFAGSPPGSAEDGSLLGTFDPGEAALGSTLEGLGAGGFTNFEAALQQTVSFFDGQPDANNIVYFLSDGFPTLGGEFVDEVDTLTDPTGIDASNVAVGVGTTSSITQLDRIDTTGGTPQVTTTDDLTAELLKPPFEVVDFTLQVAGATVGDIDADSVTATPLGFTFDFEGVSGLDPLEGAETDLTAVATIDTDRDAATTDDQFELSVTNTIAGVVPSDLLIG